MINPDDHSPGVSMPTDLSTVADGAPLTQSLPEQIAARLSERIVSGTCEPGQRIMEQAVAAEFAVSRGPVREALRLLEKDGLVTILARRGAQVTNLTIAEVKEIFDIRAMLNGLRDRQVAENPASANLLPVLKAEVEKLVRFAAEPGLGDDYVETVARIDGMLTRASGNQRLKRIQDSLMLQTLRYRQLGLSTSQRRRQSAQSWQDLVKAIQAGDGAEAERIARQRVTNSRDAAIEMLQKKRGGVPGGKTQRAA
jgi:DNA-binding GntR family transcriptional regulator